MEKGHIFLLNKQNFKFVIVPLKVEYISISVTTTKAKKIGSRLGITSAVIGILIAQVIMTLILSPFEDFFNTFFWFIEVEFFLNLLFGVSILLASGHFYGQLAGKLILIDSWSPTFMGLILGPAVIVTTGFLSGWLGFFQEGFSKIGTQDDPFYDYIYKPMYWIVLYGLIPAWLVGFWCCAQIRKRGKVDE